MRSSLFKPLFWLGVSVTVLIAIFTMLLSPVVGILLLLLFALVFVLLILLVPSLWQAVKPAKKEQKTDPLGGSRNPHQPQMMLETCSSDNQNIIISKPMFVIGRAPDSDYVFRNTKGISFHHCRITYRETTHQFFIEDLDSTYGTFLNGRRLNKNNPVPLPKGSNVAFHTHRFTFKSVSNS